MKILVISNNYPSNKSPAYGVFVYKFIQQFAHLGHEVTIIAPEAIKGPKKDVVDTYGEELGKVYRPKFISASAFQIGNFNSYRIGEYFQVQAIRKLIKREKIEFDVVYAHFLSNGFVAVKALSSFNKPVYVAVGEYNNIEVRRSYYSPKEYLNLLNKISGYIAVSPQIKDKLISLGVSDNNIIVKPNGVDFNFFFQRDKIEMRRKYKLPNDQLLVIFVGRFLDNKGPLRVVDATRNLENVKILLVGSGPETPEGKHIIFKGKVPSDKVPELLSAADIFVLPTLHEGSCNAIVEAMACGLPIISSDIPEIREQCDSSFSILVNPLDVERIESTIRVLAENPEQLRTMSKNAIASSKRFNAKERAKDVLAFISPE